MSESDLRRDLRNKHIRKQMQAEFDVLQRDIHRHREMDEKQQAKFLEQQRMENFRRKQAFREMQQAERDHAMYLDMVMQKNAKQREHAREQHEQEQYVREQHAREQHAREHVKEDRVSKQKSPRSSHRHASLEKENRRHYGLSSFLRGKRYSTKKFRRSANKVRKYDRY